MTEPPAPRPEVGDRASTDPAPTADVPRPSPGTAVPETAVPDVPVPEVPPQAWAVPPPAQRRKGLLVLVGCAGLLLFLVPVSLVALIFLGGQISEILRGTVEFGGSSSGCTVSGASTTFPVDQPVAYVAHLERQTNSGETVTIAISFEGSVADSVDQVVEGGADCLTGTLPASLLGAGHYRLEFKSGTELLSSGEFDLTP